MQRILRPLAILTVLALTIGLSSGLMAQKRPQLQGFIKKLPLSVGQRLFKGKTQSQGNSGPQLCSPNKFVSGGYTYYTRCPSGKKCPPDPVENCRVYTATCENSGGTGQYQASGTPDCLPAPDPKTPKEVLSP